MRVALLSQSARSHDAIGSQLAGKVGFLTAHGWEVRLYVEDAGHLHAELLGATRTHTAASLWRTPEEREYLRAADLILAEYGTDYDLLNVLPALCGRRPRIVLDYHGVTPRRFWQPGDESRLARAERMRHLVWCADVAVVHSRFMARELHEATGFPRERIHQIPCQVDLQRLHEPEAMPEVRRQQGLKKAFVLLYVGRLAANKRVPVLVEALARLRDSGQAVHAVVIGAADDIYELQAAACQQRARELSVNNRLHVLGQVDEATLHAWYRSADVLVMPSVHEGFCLPVVEAMAFGLPVVAARAAALPETLGDAGLSFRPDDVDDLVRQITRVQQSLPAEAKPGSGARPFSVAIVAPRYGTDFVGGAEKSLRTIAGSLYHLGHRVEVFTTCTRSESDWTNRLPPTTTEDDGIPVHRHLIDPHDRSKHLAALNALRSGAAPFAAEVEAAYLAHSLHSQELLDTLDRRWHEFDAIVIGPYLFGITWRVATRFAKQVLLLPCFHDEPFAHFAAFQQAYQNVGGILYHTASEQAFAQAELGINHPNAVLVGTLLDPACWLPATMRERESALSPTLIYCGRYAVEKGVDRLLEYARRYCETWPGRFRFEFLGQGSLPLPKEPWLADLGFVDEKTKLRHISGARALVQLSTNESLSLVTLEAWAAGVPVIGHTDCAVVREQIRQAEGGRTVANYEEFAAALDSLWIEPEAWLRAGKSGQRFVQKQYTSLDSFGAALLRGIDALQTPLAEQLRQRGLERARLFDRPAWEQRWSELLTPLLEQERERPKLRLEVEPPALPQTIAPQTGVALIPVRVHNRGDLPAAAEGPGRYVLHHEVIDPRRTRRLTGVTPLPDLLPPGATQIVVVPVKLPRHAAESRVRFAMGRSKQSPPARRWSKPLTLVVSDQALAGSGGVAQSFLVAAKALLADAHALRKLPDDYHDVTQGFCAGWKRQAKAKLLYQFRKSYVDVLSRQQSEFNDRLLSAFCQLADACTALGQGPAVARIEEDPQRMRRRLRRTLRKQRLLEQELATLRRRVERMEEHTSAAPTG